MLKANEALEEPFWKLDLKGVFWWNPTISVHQRAEELIWHRMETNLEDEVLSMSRGNIILNGYYLCKRDEELSKLSFSGAHSLIELGLLSIVL